MHQLMTDHIKATSCKLARRDQSTNLYPFKENMSNINIQTGYICQHVQAQRKRFSQHDNIHMHRET